MDSHLVELAKATANKYSLDPALVCAVVSRESSWDTWAVRYEPGFFAWLKDRIDADPTELRARAFSYGLMQVMGETAREFGFDGQFLTQLCDPSAGLDYGCQKLKHCMTRHPSDTRAALLDYNGGGDHSYPDKVLKFLPEFQG